MGGSEENTFNGSESRIKRRLSKEGRALLAAANESTPERPLRNGYDSSNVSSEKLRKKEKKKRRKREKKLRNQDKMASNMAVAAASRSVSESKRKRGRKKKAHLLCLQK